MYSVIIFRFLFILHIVYTEGPFERELGRELVNIFASL